MPDNSKTHLNIVAVRFPYWLPELDTGIPPTIKPGDWQLSTWSGKAKTIAIKLDLYKWHNSRMRTIWHKFDYPPLGLIPEYAVEILHEYDEQILHTKPWIEVLAFA